MQPDQLIQRLISVVRGKILAPGAEGYDAARRVYNGMIDRHPAAIVQCAGTEDVQAVVRFASDHDWQLAVRGGGHSAAGFGVCEGGIVIDLSLMKAIDVDPVRQTCRTQAGATWGEFDGKTQVFGLGTTGARISSAGVSGVTLGGGYGWLMRKYGLAIDNLLSAEIVLADGRLLKASAKENPDLFWGIRGGGGNFGVVVSLEFRLHPVDQVTGGMVFYPATQGREVLEFYRDFMSSAQDELSALCNFLIMPSAPFVPPQLRSVPVVAIAVCHIGSIEDARRDLSALSSLGPPLMDRIRPMAYQKLQRMYDAAGTFGHYVYGRSGHFRELPEDALDRIVAHATVITSPLSIVMLARLGGAISRIDEHDTAFSYRDTKFDLSINAVWSNPRESSLHTGWTDDLWSEIGSFSNGVYVNELGEEGEQRVSAAYNPQTYQRLISLKNFYDPANLFRLNQNIRPDPAMQTSNPGEVRFPNLTLSSQ